MKKTTIIRLCTITLLAMLSGCGNENKQEEQPVVDIQVEMPETSDTTETIPFTLKTDEITLECGPYCANDFNIEDYVVADDYSNLYLKISSIRPSHVNEEDFSHPETIYDWREVISSEDLNSPVHNPDLDPHMVIYDKETGYFSTIRVFFEDTTPPEVDSSKIKTTIDLYGLSFIVDFGEEPLVATWEDGNISYNYMSLNREYICPNFYNEDGTTVYYDYTCYDLVSVYLENCRYVFDNPADPFKYSDITITNKTFPKYGSYSDNLVFEDLYGNQTKVPVTINVINDFDPREYESVDEYIQEETKYLTAEDFPYSTCASYITAAQKYKDLHPDTNNELITRILTFAEEYQP